MGIEDKNVALFRAAAFADMASPEQVGTADRIGASGDAVQAQPQMAEASSNELTARQLNLPPQAIGWLSQHKDNLAAASAELRGEDPHMPKLLRTIGNVSGDTVKALGAGLTQTNSGLVATAESQLRVLGEGERGFSQLFGVDNPNNWGRAADWLAKWRQQGPDAVVKSLNQNRYYHSWLADKMANAPQSVGNMLAGLIGTAITGSLVPMMAAAGVTTFGQTAAQDMDAGVPVFRAIGHAAADASFETMLEKIPAEKFLSDYFGGKGFLTMLGHQLVAENLTEVPTTLLQNFDQWALVNQDKPFGDFLSEQPEAVAETIIATTLAAGAQTGVLHTTARLVGGKPMTKAEEAEQGMKELHENVRAAGMASAAPEKMRSLSQAFAGDGVFYIPPQQATELVAGLPDSARAALLKANPDLSQQLAEAEKAGVHIVIPKADYIAYIAPHPVADAVASFVKTNPNVPSVGEEKLLREFVKANPDLFKPQGPQPSKQEDMTDEQVTRAVQQAFVQAGGTQAEAQQLAPLFTAGTGRFSTAFGQSALQALSERGITFSREDSSGQKVASASPMQQIVAELGEYQAAVAQGQEPAIPAERKAALDEVAAKLQERGMQAAELAAMTPQEFQSAFYGGLDEQRSALKQGDYTMTHRPPSPDDGAPAYDVTGGGDFYPDDFYGPDGLRVYNTGDKKSDAESYAVLKKVRGNPNASVTIYRAVPKGTPDAFNAGDWVTLSRTYAEQHGISNVGNDYDVAKKVVKAGEIFTNADSLNEFGYWPEGKTLYQSAPTFFSQVERTVDGLKMTKAPGAHWLNTIKNAPGVKQEELDWMGLPEWLAAQQGSVTKEAVLDFINANQIEVKEVVKGEPKTTNYHVDGGRDGFTLMRGDEIEDGPFDTPEEAYAAMREQEEIDGNGDITQFSQWQLPGGSNYRELMFTLPVTDKNNVFDTPDVHKYRDGKSDDNRVAWMRFNERTDADGKRVLFIEEIQSDWHQKGRENGYKSDAAKATNDMNDLTAQRYKLLSESGANGLTLTQVYETPEYKEIIAKIDALKSSGAMLSSVPDAPFKTTWPELAFKRALRWAVENGFDRVAWTTGEQQADRYNLSKQVERIVVAKEDGKFRVFLRDNSGKNHDAGLKTAQELPDVVGKDLANKISDQKNDSQTYKGNDLKVGGEGMKGFYDKILPATVNKLVKKWGAKVGETTLADQHHYLKDQKELNKRILSIYEKLDDRTWKISSDVYLRRNRNGNFSLAKKTLDGYAPYSDYNSSVSDLLNRNGIEVEKSVASRPLGENVHSLDITPAMKESVMQGLPLFQGERGQITLDALLKNVEVTFKSGANFSTGIHEFGHYMVALHRQYAVMARKNQLAGTITPAQQRILDDWETLKQQVGAQGDEFTVPQEEKLAKLFEAHMHNGKAPSPKLQRSFARYRKWLMQIYRDLKSQLGVELNEEVRGVFDRWLASEDEIAQASASDAMLRQTAEEIGGDVLGRVDSYVEQVKAEAEEKLYRRLNREAGRQQREAYQAALNEAKKEIGPEVAAQPVYGLMDYMRKNGVKLTDGPELDGIDPDLLTDGPDGVPPDSLAELFGYGSGARMVSALKKAPPLAEAIEREARASVREQFPDMVENGKIKAEALRAYTNDKTLLALDLMVQEMGLRAGKKDENLKTLMRALARERLQTMPMKDVERPQRYLVARDRALQQALLATRKGDVNAALTSLKQAMFNQSIWQETSALLETKQAFDQLVRKVNRKDKKLPSSWHPDFVYYARSILSRFGLSRTLFKADEWIAGLAKEDPDVLDQLVSLDSTQALGSKPFKELTVAEFGDLNEAITNIIHVGRAYQTIEVNGRRIAVQQASDEVNGALLAKAGKPRPEGLGDLSMMKSWGDWFRKLEASLVRVESFARWIDDDNPNGPFTSLIYRPVADAVGRSKELKGKYLKQMVEMVQSRADEFRKTKVDAPELATVKFNGRFASKWTLVSALLNYGNEQNRLNLLEGYGWKDEDFRRVVERELTAADVRFVQKVWDFLEEIKPFVKAEYKQRTGLELPEVEAAGFTMHGQKLRGGYYPLMANRDPQFDTFGGMQFDTRNMMFDRAGSPQWPASRRSFTKQRTGAIYPPSLDITVALRHVEDVMHNYAVAPALMQVARIINHRRIVINPNTQVTRTVRPFVEAIGQVNPQLKDAFIPWLQATARNTVNQVAGSTAVESAAAILRARSTMVIMGGNIVNAAQNYSSITQVIDEIGLAAWSDGQLKYMQSPIESRAFIEARSAEMKHRYEALDRETQEVIGQLTERAGKAGDAARLVRMYAFVFQSITDRHVAYPAWLGAYNKAYKENPEISEPDAVYLADRAVRTAVGAPDVKDTAAVQRGSQLQRLTTMFYGYMNMVYNRQRVSNLRLRGGQINFHQWLTAHVLNMILPNLVAATIVDALGGGGAAPDDEDWMSWYAMRVLTGYFGLVPLVRDVASGVTARLLGQQVGASINNPIYSTLERGAVGTAGALHNIATGKGELDKTVSASLIAAGLLFNLPIGIVKNPAAAVANWLEGDNVPQNPAAAAQQLLNGPPPK